MSNEGYLASLVVRRLYETVPDDAAAAGGLLRIVDESGEDYLFPAELFETIDVPEALERKLALAR